VIAPFGVESIAPDDVEWRGGPISESRTDTGEVS